jgi:hypothetical protein
MSAARMTAPALVTHGIFPVSLAIPALWLPAFRHVSAFVTLSV